jgi:phosphoglycolate phosphatase
VVTNKHSRFSNPLTQAMPLFASAQTVVSGDTTPHAKPHPAPLLEAATRLGLPPQQCIYVGDDERDILAMRQACPRWQPPTATWARKPISVGGAPMLK